MASEGNVVLSYHNCLLRRSDQILLQGCGWLNDQLIAFSFEYCEYDLFKDSASCVAFISPDITQFIKLSQDAEVGMFLEALDLPNKQLIFLAINDNDSSASTGGSHWSLLVFWRSDYSFRHYDSCGSYNERAARDVARKLQPHIGPTGKKASFIHEQSPQQQNGYDCGLFVICTTEHLCRQSLQGCQVPLLEAVTQAAVTRKRQDILKLIADLGSMDTE
ncbi:sentrin-specific protease 8-like [Diadema antillarum]|uniref:sentrin-specific protease 8-like n=1 Tax=Diadema antillarum TaxID=105358 RepID=UPI003A86FADC